MILGVLFMGIMATVFVTIPDLLSSVFIGSGDSMSGDVIALAATLFTILATQ